MLMYGFMDLGHSGFKRLAFAFETPTTDSESSSSKRVRSVFALLWRLIRHKPID